MSDQFWLSKEQLARISGFFPLSHGVPRVDDRKVVSGIIHVIRNAACAGVMHLPPMGRIRPYITGSYAGRGWVSLTGYSPHWLPKTSHLIG